MGFEVDQVGALVHVEARTDAEWGATAELFAQDRGGQRLLAGHASLGAGGQRRGVGAIWKRYTGPPLPADPVAERRALAAYCVQRQDVEDAINQLLGRDPEQHRPPRLAWASLIRTLAEHGAAVSEQELIAMPFVFEFSAESELVFTGE